MENPTQINNPENKATTDIMNHIVKASTAYNKNDYNHVFDLLADSSLPIATDHEIDILNVISSVTIDERGPLESPKYLPTVIRQTLHSFQSSNRRYLSLVEVVPYEGKKPVPEEKIPMLWQRVRALCYLEEWSHLLGFVESGDVEEKRDFDSTNKEENRVALFLHDKLGVKLPRYFLEGYEREKLGLPIEDHDFDKIDAGV